MYTTKRKKGQKTEKRQKAIFHVLNKAKDLTKKSFMRSGSKQQRNWKLDDERGQRLTTSSGETISIEVHNHRPGNYTHERSHTGIHIELGHNTDVRFYKQSMR